MQIVKKNKVKYSFKINVLILVFVFLSACKEVNIKNNCSMGEVRTISAFVYFGRSTPTGEVSVKEWERFVDDVITTNFPGGFTTWNARGQWKSSNNQIISENSYVLNLIYIESLLVENKLQTVVNQYITNYNQDAVLISKSVSCTNF